VNAGKLAGAAGIAFLGCALGFTAWAQQPAEIVTEDAARPAATWTPSAQAPAGTLSHALEAQRHDSFIERAQKGDIDLVFFGTTETEMWSWNEGRGKGVWDRELGPLKAANFGSQGTTRKSLLWRMQNGELDGYEAKLVVIQLAGARNIADPFLRDGEAEFVAAWSSIIAEIRARQPQAKILFHTPIPRGISPVVRREEWREIWDANAAVIARLTDDETVFFSDFGERYFNPDGSYNHDYWGGMPGPNAVGAQPAAFELWAEQLKPWLDRFVR
jgi:hypothetical protein